MSFTNGPTLVTNGLLLALDAGDRNSYVSGSNTWLDLVGTNNGTLVNGPTFSSGSGGSIVFDGVDDYATVPSSTSWAIGSAGTISMWAYFTGSVTTNHRFWCTFNTSTGLDAYIDAATGYVGFHGSATLTTTLFPRNQWVNLTTTYTGGNIAVYYNGILQPIQGKTTGYNITQVGSLFIAQYSGGGGYTWRGRISSLTVHNRGLSADEVQQNFNALRGRFGI